MAALSTSRRYAIRGEARVTPRGEALARRWVGRCGHGLSPIRRARRGEDPRPRRPVEVDAGRAATHTVTPGVVCFITIAGFLDRPGFEKMRDYLRRMTDEIWVIDCWPEGHQLSLSAEGCVECPSEWHAPVLPESIGA